MANKFNIKLKTFCLKYKPYANQTFRPKFQFTGNREARGYQEDTIK